MEEFLNEIIRLNPNDELYIDEKSFWESMIIKNIVSKYGFNEKNKIRVYVLAKTIWKFNNKNVNHQIESHKERNKELIAIIDDMIFLNLKNIKEENLNYFYSIIINYLL